MKVKTFVDIGLVFISLESENGGLVRAISEDKFVENYKKYVELYPKRSISKHGGTIARKAIENVTLVTLESRLLSLIVMGFGSALVMIVMTA